jgi:hypothetical protein
LEIWGDVHGHILSYWLGLIAFFPAYELIDFVRGEFVEP